MLLNRLKWRNSVCFIADDGDGGLHLSDSEKLAAIVNDNHSELLNKIKP